MNLQVPRVLDYFRQVILREDMDKESALLLNAGAHYIKVLTHGKREIFLPTNVASWIFEIWLNLWCVVFFKNVSISPPLNDADAVASKT